MRISTPLMSDNVLARLQANAERLFRIQDQLSSGKRLLSPSDDPPGHIKAFLLELVDVLKHDVIALHALDLGDVCDAS